MLLKLGNLGGNQLVKYVFNLSTQNARVFVVCNAVQCVIVCFYITQHKTTFPIKTINVTLRITPTRTISIGDNSEHGQEIQTQTVK